MNTELPTDFAYLFWDVDFTTLSVDLHRMFIIERLLEKGDLTSAQWVYRTYKKREIQDVIKTSRNISPSTKNMWSIILNT